MTDLTGKPTPTPWVRYKAGIGEENGQGIVSLWRAGEEREANAALIVRAVNAHDDLVAALEMALPYVDDCVIDGRTEAEKHKDDPDTYQRRLIAVESHRLTSKLFRAALALAGEQP